MPLLLLLLLHEAGAVVEGTVADAAAAAAAVPARALSQRSTLTRPTSAASALDTARTGADDAEPAPSIQVSVTTVAAAVLASSSWLSSVSTGADARGGCPAVPAAPPSSNNCGVVARPNSRRANTSASMLTIEPTKCPPEIFFSLACTGHTTLCAAKCLSLHPMLQ
jgi:hypothetical protein